MFFSKLILAMPVSAAVLNESFYDSDNGVYDNERDEKIIRNSFLNYTFFCFTANNLSKI